MNQTRLDALTRAWQRSRSRRGIVGALLAGAGALVALPAPTIAARRRCRNGLKKCGGRCVNRQIDRAHCGGCDTPCDVTAACVAGVCCTPGEAGCVAAPTRPFPAPPGYATGTILPNHRDQTTLNNDVRAAYDRWKARYVVFAGNDGDGQPLFRIAFGKPGSANYDRTVSEGMGFGMVILPHLAGHDPEAQTIFDGLWRFVRKHPSVIEPRLMAWKIPGGDDSAFDGDCDMAYGLLLAHEQWGSTADIDYQSELTTLLGGILEATIGPSSRLPMLGDWVNPNGGTYNQYTPRTSDFMLGHFRAFRRFSGETVWDTVATTVSDVMSDLQTTASPETGLLPDFVEAVSESPYVPHPADPNFLEGPNDGNFSYNAGRDPWRIGADALINDQAASRTQADKITQWAKSTTGGDPANIRAGYTLSGQPVSGSNYFTTFFAAPLGVAAMMDGAHQQWLNDIYDAVFAVNENYYEDSVTLLCLLAMTGNFWDPTA